MMRNNYIVKRYVWINTDWSDYLKLFEHDINNDYLWCLLLLLLIILIIAENQKKQKRSLPFSKQMILTQRYVRNIITLHYKIFGKLPVAMIVSYEKFCLFYRHVLLCQKRKNKPCNHTEYVNYQRQDNPPYFSAAYINANKSWPWSCFQCSINLGSDYKANNKHPAMVCENAAKHEHDCMCAMCIHCYNKMQSNEAKPSR